MVLLAKDGPNVKVKQLEQHANCGVWCRPPQSQKFQNKDEKLDKKFVLAECLGLDNISSFAATFVPRAL